MGGLSGTGISGESQDSADALLFVLRNANFQSTSDQQFTKLQNFGNYVVTKIVAFRKTGGATVACAGGVYSATAKGGFAIVAAGQSWLGLAGAGNIVDATLAAATLIRTETPYLSLTTGSTAAVTADVFFYGVVLD
jgi:hypothetical protein